MFFSSFLFKLLHPPSDKRRTIWAIFLIRTSFVCCLQLLLLIAFPTKCLILVVLPHLKGTFFQQKRVCCQMQFQHLTIKVLLFDVLLFEDFLKENVAQFNILVSFRGNLQLHIKILAFSQLLCFYCYGYNQGMYIRPELTTSEYIKANLKNDHLSTVEGSVPRMVVVHRFHRLRIFRNSNVCYS